MCVGAKFLAFYVLLYTKFELKVIGNSLCTPKIFKNPLKNFFFIRNILITNCVEGVLIVMRYFLFKNRLLMDY